MPTYEYECSKCGHEFELFQRMTENPKRKCPKCGRMALQRLIGAGAAVIFKGSGFYETDYKRSGDYKKRKSEESGSSTKGSDKGSDEKSSTDTKSETKKTASDD